MGDSIDRAMAGSLPDIATTADTTGAGAMLADIKEVNVTFTSSIPSLSSLLPPTPLTVPTELTRYGLSELVNQLLENDTNSYRPFDFLVEAAYLRSSLLAYLRSAAITGERGLTLEVIEAVSESQSERSQQPHPDWIAAISAIDAAHIVTGCYDGIVRVVNRTNHESESLVLGSGHRSAVKCVRIIGSGSDSGSATVISGSKDQTVRVWHYDPTSTKGRMSCVSVGTSHNGSIEALAVLDETTKFASAGWDREINLWDTRLTQPLADDQQPLAKKSKRGSDITSLKLLSTITGHSDVVTGLYSPFPTQLFSCSYDCTVRHFDLTTGSQSHSWHSGAGKSLTCVSVSEDGRTIAVGGMDTAWRLIDSRADGDRLIRAYRSHTGAVSSLCYGDNSFTVYTGSYDGTVKMWDTRSHVPLTTLKSMAGTDRVLAVDWTSEATEARHGCLISGGTDKKLSYHTVGRSQPPSSSQSSTAPMTEH